MIGIKKRIHFYHIIPPKDILVRSTDRKHAIALAMQTEIPPAPVAAGIHSIDALLKQRRSISRVSVGY